MNKYILCCILGLSLLFSTALNAQIIITIPKGSPTKKISQILKHHNIIKNEFKFRLYVKAKKLDTELQAGTFIFDTQDISYKTITKILTSKELANQLQKVVLQEGLILDEIAQRFYDKGIVLSKKQFLDYLNKKALTEFKKKYTFLKKLPINSLEGYLYPETYSFRLNTPYHVIVKKLLDQFNTNIYQVWLNHPKKPAYTFHQTLSLAAIVEKEAFLDSELRLISSVYHNRLNIDMKLEADPTVAYGIGQPRKKIIFYKDLRTPSAYNTYLNKGIPPGPISSVGKDAFLATLNPQKSPYLFFVATGDGGHQFSRTYKEHLKKQKVYHRLILNQLKNK